MLFSAAVLAVAVRCCESQQQPSQRLEWRALKAHQQTAYIAAVQCLQKHQKDSQKHEKDSHEQDLSGQINRKTHHSGSAFDDHSRVHAYAAPYAAEQSRLLPFSRAFLFGFEAMLAAKCAFAGTLPYWDWGLDAADLAKAPVWSTSTGFGGDGNTKAPFAAKHCITNGPFKDLHSKWPYPSCIRRNFRFGKPDRLPIFSTATHAKTFTEFTQIITTQYTLLRHKIGGSVAEDRTAANDPVLYLILANIDRLWAAWQAENPTEAAYKSEHHIDEKYLEGQQVFPF